MAHQYTNNLINESSPYLLQHAHNPVNWEAWNTLALQKAKNEDKLMLISIGYAACHWCHVMEHECFEDEEVAKTMNAHFVNIKVDREERPDIDHIYMDALQMMTGSGGWPLNILALPDGRPFWGATFVKKAAWIQVLNQLQELYLSDPEKIIGYAENMAQGLNALNGISVASQSGDTPVIPLKDIVQDWSAYFDTFLGGYKRAPKFMMPVNLNFFMHYGVSTGDSYVTDYVHTTLTRMAWGGLFDHVGGGFSRYSVDTKWHVPHFEKMLYDNGQLISLYAKAYAATKNELYRNVVHQCISFLKAELLDTTNGFCSSLDADSLTVDGTLEEGAFYVWQEEHLQPILGKRFPVFKDYFNINDYGYWEHQNYVLIRDAEVSEIAEKHTCTEKEVSKIIARSLKRLKKEREKRDTPKLDDKILTSWNGLALKGLTDAYRYLGNEEYFTLALKNASFLEARLIGASGEVYHNYKNGVRTIPGFLEDYASLIDAYLGVYEITYAEKWLNLSLKLTHFVLDNFSDPATALFFFTSEQEEPLIRKTIEVADNVIPSSNSIMAHNLLKLSKYVPSAGFEERVSQMMRTMEKTINEHPQNHAHWLDLALLLQQEFYEIAIVGKDHLELSKNIQAHYLPNVIFAASAGDHQLALLKGRFVKDKTFIYVCNNGTCQLPAQIPDEALQLISTTL